jgi:putative spermidine/putrescine transport system ATP-binding protein
VAESVLAAVTRASTAGGEPGAAFVEFDHVQKTYDGEHLAVDDLSFGIVRGEFLTLLGPSGSGKTTALMMLAGFEVPTAGDIRLAGRSLARVAPYRRNMGVVFQNYALFPHMTVAENLAFPLSVRRLGRPEIVRRIDRVLDMVRLGGFRARRPAELSGGQQQRVALARALIFDPDVILMDEPLGALDKQLREQLQIEVKHIQKNLGVTVVYVTHDQSEALTMSDRIAVLKDGRLQQLATPEELYDRPRSAFVARFVGESNRLTGRVLVVDRDRCTVETDAGLKIQALAVNIGPSGSRTTLSIRPERVLLLGAESPCENALPAEVEELIFHGDHRRVRMRIADGGEFFLKLASGEGGPTLVPGQRVRIGWRTADCRALDA